MNPQAEDLFHELADLPPGERERYFRERRIPAELRAEVEELLRFDSETGDPIPGFVAASAQRLLQKNDRSVETVRCGPYRLSRLLGRGGMGSVYLAERADGEVRQQVAIKILRYAGDEPLFLDRFLRERQILAALTHPGIARLLDAGHTADARPYLAMEYIEGVPIDVYAEPLDLRGKLALFTRLCEAVSFAHRNLVIHRDIKPSNVLVDASGQPKLLDFGIAKILDAAADQTVTQERLLTPEYASPEQVRGSAQSTAGDIYSLGAVLYKLLTGRAPHTFTSGKPEAVAFAICSVEPAAPSRVNPGLPKDLDFILAKALRKEPEERYPSADAFADDIRAFLQLRPVRARSGDRGYRTRKFLRRRWLPATAAALVVASLTGGLYLTARERALAQRRFVQVRRLAHTFIFDFHDDLARIEGSTKVREKMVQTGLQYLDDLARDAGDDPELQREIAAAYMKIGDAQGYPTKPNLGRVADGLASYRKAGEIYRRLASRNDAGLADLAAYYLQYAGYIRFAGDKNEARKLSESAIETFDRLRAGRSMDSQSQDRYMTAWCTLGDIDEDLGEYTRAWNDFQRCGDLARMRLRTKRDARALSALSQADERIGTAAQELGYLNESLRALREDETLLAELLKAEPRNPALHRREALLHFYRSTVYYSDFFPSLDDAPRALESARRYLAAAEEMVRSDPTNATARFSRAIATGWCSVPLRESDARAAVAMAGDAVRLFDELMASGKPGYLVASRRVRALEWLGEAQLKAGRAADARRTAETALAAERPIVSNSADQEERVLLVQLLILAGNAHAAANDFERAESLLHEGREEAQPLAARHELANLVPLARSEEALGSFYARRGRTEEARACFQRLADLWRQIPGPNEYVDRQRAAAERLLASLR